MRTTISLDPDVAAAIDEVRRTEGVGLSAAVNDLIRRGLAKPDRATGTPPYQPRSAPLGIKVDITHIGDVLDVLDDERSSHAS